MSYLDDLKGVVDRVTDTVYMTSRADIVDYYQDKYGANWKDHIIGDLVQQTGKSKNTVSREFQYDKRLGMERYKNTRISKSTAAKYEKLGKNLPPVKKSVPPGGFSITIKGKVDPSPKSKRRGGGIPREREFTVDFKGSDAIDFANNPSLEQFFELYGVDGEAFAGSLHDATIS